MARLIRHHDLLATPWKNGGGSTTEIALAPAGAGFDDFDWRISLATIARSGPFSSFPGIDRSLALVDGAGVGLSFDGERRITLSPANPLVWFAGEAQVFATVGPSNSVSTDFNVMTRRERCRHQLESLAAPASLVRRSATTLLFLAQGASVVLAGAGTSYLLGRYDALLLDGADVQHWTIGADGAAATVLVADLIT